MPAFVLNVYSASSDVIMTASNFYLPRAVEQAREGVESISY